MVARLGDRTPLGRRQTVEIHADELILRGERFEPPYQRRKPIWRLLAVGDDRGFDVAEVLVVAVHAHVELAEVDVHDRRLPGAADAGGSAATGRRNLVVHVISGRLVSRWPDQAPGYAARRHRLTERRARRFPRRGRPLKRGSRRLAAAFQRATAAASAPWETAPT